MAVRSDTRAVASLTSDSPSRIVTIRRGSPIRRATAVAATASGGATTAPRANATAKGTPSIHQVTRPTPGGGEQHQPHRQAEDRGPVGAEVHERRADRRGIQQGRQQADEHDLGAQLRLGDERDVADRRPPRRAATRGAATRNRWANPATTMTVPMMATMAPAVSTRPILAGAGVVRVGRPPRAAVRPASGQSSSPSTASRRVSRPTPPMSRARRWKSLSENASPSRSATWSRSCIQSRSPIL